MGQTDIPGLSHLCGWGRRCCGRGGPKPWGQVGQMTLLAGIEAGCLPAQRRRKFYGRKLDLKANRGLRAEGQQDCSSQDGPGPWQRHREGGQPGTEAQKQSLPPSSLGSSPASAVCCVTVGAGPRPRTEGRFCKQDRCVARIPPELQSRGGKE